MTITTTANDYTPTPYGDLWYTPNRFDGSPIPMYSDRLCQMAAIAACLAGDLGSLTAAEINFMRDIVPTTNH